jgi:hypothetical protein
VGKNVTPFKGFTPVPGDVQVKGHDHRSIGGPWYDAENTIWVLYEVDEVVPGGECNPGLERAVEAVKEFLKR